MKHFIFNRDGVIEALGLNSLDSFNYYIKKAEKQNAEVSKIIGGVELFDIDTLEHPEKYANEKSRDSKGQLHFSF